jgi:hypothetical protein
MIWYIPETNFDRSDCLPLLKCRVKGNLRKLHNTMHTIQWKRLLREYERFTNLLGTLRAIRLSEMVMTLFRISFYVYDVKSLSADPYMCYLRSPMMWHISRVEEVRDLRLGTTSMWSSYCFLHFFVRLKVYNWYNFYIEFWCWIWFYYLFCVGSLDIYASRLTNWRCKMGSIRRRTVD